MFAKILKIFCVFIFCLGIGFSQDEYEEEDQILEYLFSDITFVSQSKFEETLISVPAAVHVITGQDIIASGAKKITDLFRLVPGMNVADLSAHARGISIRGFLGRHSNKLLVLVDGRTIYTPIFTGTQWEYVGFLLENIERIEIIRGPGATTWGANAVNGIINIITKKPSNTSSLYVAGNIGSESTYIGEINAKAGSETFSINAGIKYEESDGFNDVSGAESINSMASGNDYYDKFHGELGLEWSLANEKQLIIRGGGNIGTNHELNIAGAAEEEDFENNYIIVDFSMPSINLKTYYFSDVGESDQGSFEAEVDTYDITFDHRLSLGDNYKIVWGMGYRYTEYVATNIITPESDLDAWNLFIQNELNFTENLSVIFGVKAEDHEYTGIDYSPRVSFQRRTELDQWRISWSRAHRVPSIDEDDFRFFIGMGYINGNKDLDPELLDAYEIGYRKMFSDRTSIDLTLFYHEYEDLISTRPNFSFFPTFSLNYSVENFHDGESKGFELLFRQLIGDYWNFSIGLSYLDLEIDIDIISRTYDTITPRYLYSAPEWSGFISNVFTLPYKMQLTVNAFYNGETQWPSISRSGLVVLSEIDDYLRIDLRFAKYFDNGIELEVVGQNLLDEEHLEGAGDDGVIGYIPRYFYAAFKIKR